MPKGRTFPIHYLCNSLNITHYNIYPYFLEVARGIRKERHGAKDKSYAM